VDGDEDDDDDNDVIDEIETGDANSVRTFPLRYAELPVFRACL